MAMLGTEKASKRGENLVYKILYHKDGYIRLEVPSLRKLAWSTFFATFRKTPPISLPPAIKAFHVNPLQGNIVITYEPAGFDIHEYIQKMVSDPYVKKIMKG
jgi:hypothetical protein